MNPNQRFSILTFPQFYDGAELGLNIVVLPRDQNPLANAIEDEATIPDAPPFADAQLSFTASIFDSLSGFPHNHAPIQGLALPTVAPANSRAIFEALAAQLSIVNLDTTNRNLDLAAIPADPQAIGRATQGADGQEVPARELSPGVSFHRSAPRQSRHR